jgi:chromosome segregation ATPase
LSSLNILFEGSLSNSSSSINTNKQSLTEDLKKYGSIISTIQEFNHRVDKLKNQIDELQKRKQCLEAQNQKIISILTNSEIVVKFLNRSDDSIGNDKENVKILAIITFILYTLYLRYSGIEESVDDDLGRLFVRLSKAVAVEGEETISIPELKMVITKALNGLIAKLDTKTQAEEEISY